MHGIAHSARQQKDIEIKTESLESPRTEVYSRKFLCFFIGVLNRGRGVSDFDLV